jgi:hypothetical protein
MTGPDPAILRSWESTTSDLRWVLERVVIGREARRWAFEYLDHNELGLAWEAIAEALVDPAPAVAKRMERARRRMGISRNIRRP